MSGTKVQNATRQTIGRENQFHSPGAEVVEVQTSKDPLPDTQMMAQELVSQHGLEISLRLIGELVRECRQLMRSRGPRPKKPASPASSL